MNERLSREAMLSVSDGETKEVYVEHWGGSVVLRCMGALDYHRVRSRHRHTDWDDPESIARFALLYLSKCIVDPDNGELVFDGEEGIAALGRHSPESIDLLFSAALSLHGAGAGEDEALEKKHEKTPTGAGGSDSVGSADTPTQTSSSPS